MEQQKFTEEHNRGMTSELNKRTAKSLSSVYAEPVFEFQTILVLFFLFPLLIFLW